MWIRALGGLGIVLVLSLLSLPAWVVWQSRDLPEVDDGDLVPRWSQVSPEHDAFVLLQAAADTLVGADQEIPAEALRGDPAALTALAPLVDANAPALEAVEGVLAAPAFQVPRVETVDPDASHIGGWLRIAKLLALRGLLDGPGSEKGLSDLLATLELSRRVEIADGASLIEVVTAIDMRDTALDALTTWLGEGELDAGAARDLARRLERYRSDAGAWARAVGVEYANLKRFVIRDLERARDGQVLEQDAQAVHQLLPLRYYFHPNRTFQSFAERYRVAAGNGGRLCSALAPIPGSGEQDSPSALRLFLSPNAGGQVLLAVGTPDYHRYQYRRCATDSHLAALQTMAALRAWQLERGELPVSLAALVPAFLDAVPEDAFDGEPLRWSRERAWLYSVGHDLSDDGGQEGEAKAGDTREPTFPLRFVGSAPPGTEARSQEAGPRSGSPS